MEWAVFEAKVGRPAKARQLFEEGSKLDPAHPPLLAAWAAFEASQKDFEEASRIQVLADADSIKGDVCFLGHVMYLLGMPALCTFPVLKILCCSIRL